MAYKTGHYGGKNGFDMYRASLMTGADSFDGKSMDMMRKQFAKELKEGEKREQKRLGFRNYMYDPEYIIPYSQVQTRPQTQLIRRKTSRQRLLPALPFPKRKSNRNKKRRRTRNKN